MSVWVDPILPTLATPSWNYLKENPVRFGAYEATMSPHQWDMTFCQEKFPCWVGGVRSGKTQGGIDRALRLTLFIPNNRGIVGRQYQTDLIDTTQRDFYEIANATGLVKSQNERKLVMYCCDPITGAILPNKPTSEVLFLHLDNPKHIKGHGIGWAWLDEASECDPDAYFRLVDRLSHPAAEGHYTVFVTSNPEGRNWVWKQWFDPETVMKRRNQDRLKHRAIHNKTKDSPFLTEEYLENLYATAPEDWLKRYAEGEFDVFEGQIYKEFNHAIHCVKTRDCIGWDKKQPPKSWTRYLGIDTGGAEPWAFDFTAVDPYGNLVCYDEIYRPEVYVKNFEPDLKSRMADLKFAKIPMDYENKEAQEELRRIGVKVTNAIKRNKAFSVNKLARYLHPNPLRRYPDWHPKRGEAGSPGIFFTENVPRLVEEIPQQKWKEQNGVAVNEADQNVADHATHGLYYILRERPEPNALAKGPLDSFEVQPQDRRSGTYWLKVAGERLRKANEPKRWSQTLPPPTKQRVWVN